MSLVFALALSTSYSNFENKKFKGLTTFREYIEVFDVCLIYTHAKRKHYWIFIYRYMHNYPSVCNCFLFTFIFQILSLLTLVLSLFHSENKEKKNLRSHIYILWANFLCHSVFISSLTPLGKSNAELMLHAFDLMTGFLETKVR